LKVKPKARPEAVDTSSNDPNAIRTLVLSGLPKDLTKAVLWKKVRKADETIDLRYPIEGEIDTGRSDFRQLSSRVTDWGFLAHLICSSHSTALAALPKLHGHTYKGSIISCVLKKRLEKLSQVEKGKGASHAGRLIVRNLAWDVSGPYST
jgi:nucleolar protein 4